MPRPYKPLAFANEFISKAIPDGVEHMKLQKLTYISYGWWLAFHDEPILSEAPQVWKHGPVFNSMYHALSHFGRAPIRTCQKDNPFSPAPRIDDGDTDCQTLLDWIWNRYGAFDAFYLSDLTHRPGNPWYEVAKNHNFEVPRFTEIPVDIIRTHYRKLAVQYGFRTAA